MTHDPNLGRVLDEIGCLAGVSREVTELEGGLTNHNYRVRTARHDVVVRVSDLSGLLAVDREAEFENSTRAARAGVGAPVVDYLRGRGVLVVGYVPSTTYADDDVAANLGKVAAVVRELHSAEPFVNRFDFFALQRRYLAIVQDNGFRLPQGYLDLLPVAARVEAAMSCHPEPLVPCHNDLLAANFLDTGERLRIIDYEYSGMNESAFELGDIVQEAGLGPEALAELVTAYDGQESTRRIARADLWRIMSAYGWTLWGAIQAGGSDLDFDFWGWGMAKFDVAQGAFATKAFEDLLDVVGGPA
ncbi:MAG: phosphotransferase [Nostocoides sp.]